MRLNDIDRTLLVEKSCLQARFKKKKLFFSISILFLSWMLEVTQNKWFWTWDIANQKFQKSFGFHLIICYVCKSAKVVRTTKADGCAVRFALQMYMPCLYYIARAVNLLWSCNILGVYKRRFKHYIIIIIMRLWHPAKL